MQRILSSVTLFLLASAIIFSCRKEEEFTSDAVQLVFSDDSLFFDTVFTQFGSGNRPLSVTKQLRVTNPNEQAVKVNIRLAGNQYGVFKLNIDGQPANSLFGKEIRGKDSIIIFVQVYLNSSNPLAPFIITDQLIFETNGNMQDVDLITKGKDAIFHMNEVLDCATGNLVWNNDMPHVIYDSILIQRGCTLTIQPGTHVYSHVKSVIIVLGTLVVNGSETSPVIFEGDRLEADYKDFPGQWGGFWFTTPSRDNVIHHAIIKNGLIGVQVDSLSVNSNPKLVIRESRIQNMSGFGILGLTGEILAVNNLVSNCGQCTFVGAYGGDYKLYHNTFVTYNSSFSSRNGPTFFLQNAPLPDGTAFPINCVSLNNIIWGSNETELAIDYKEGGNTSILPVFQNTLIRIKTDDPLYPWLNTNNNILNQDPQFENAAEDNYELKSGSPVKAKGIYVNVTEDLKQRMRSNPPSMGCYE